MASHRVKDKASCITQRMCGRFSSLFSNAVISEDAHLNVERLHMQGYGPSSPRLGKVLCNIKENQRGNNALESIKRT